jgi:two-component system sensor histidine kinase HydH
MIPASTNDRATRWTLIGALLLVMLLVAIVATEQIRRLNATGTRLMIEKGAALMRAFEAGTRTGMMELPHGGFRLQRLLSETAQQPDIAYLYIADNRGRILMHSDPSRSGTFAPDNLDLAATSRTMALRWRTTEDEKGEPIFAIFRQFTPTTASPRRHGGHMMNRRFPEDIRKRLPGPEADAQLAVVVGLHTDTIQALRTSGIRHTIMMSVVLLLIGASGVALLYFIQRYRKTRDSLSRARAYSDTIVTHMPIGLVAIDSAGQIVATNAQAKHLLGAARQQPISGTADESLPPALAQLLDKVKKYGSVAEPETTFTRPDGSRATVEVHIQPMGESDGRHLGWILLLRDIAEVQALRRELTRNQRLAAVGRLAGGVAHEIRNPLSSLKGFATYFKDRYRDAPEDRHTAEIMIQEVERLNRVVGQLLDFSRPVKLARRETDLAALIKKAAAVVGPDAAHHHIDITIDYPDDLPHPPIDADRMHQLFLNLFLNAIEAMPQGGQVMVTVVRASKSTITATVHDNGPGMTPETLAHLFEPYYTTKSLGAGLGLSNAHNIIEAHGGTIAVKSEPSSGTTFTITLPIRHDP